MARKPMQFRISKWTIYTDDILKFAETKGWLKIGVFPRRQLVVQRRLLVDLQYALATVTRDDKEGQLLQRIMQYAIVAWKNPPSNDIGDYPGIIDPIEIYWGLHPRVHERVKDRTFDERHLPNALLAGYYYEKERDHVERGLRKAIAECCHIRTRESCFAIREKVESLAPGLLEQALANDHPNISTAMDEESGVEMIILPNIFLSDDDRLLLRDRGLTV